MSPRLIDRAGEGYRIQAAIPRLVEIVGPAGAGKSTLCQALAHSSGHIRLENFPDVRRMADAPFFIRNGIQSLPFILRFPGRSRGLTRREFAWLSILNGWPRLLHRELGTHHKTIVLDQGPVYLFTEIYESGPDYLRNGGHGKALQALYAGWAAMLDAIVWLDASNEVLAGRIRGRHKAHIVKDKTAETTFAFLDRFRSGYARTLSLLTAHRSDIRVLSFDTSQESPEQITDELLAAFGLAP